MDSFGALDSSQIVRAERGAENGPARESFLQKWVASYATVRNQNELLRCHARVRSRRGTR